jgi:hypothetical protein
MLTGGLTLKFSSKTFKNCNFEIKSELNSFGNVIIVRELNSVSQKSQVYVDVNKVVNLVSVL